MTRLSARTGADVHLADAFAEPGCPLCRERARTGRLYLEAILAESVNDVPFRRALDAGRGFCGPHARAVLDADRRRAGSLGAAILLGATLAARLRDLEGVRAARGRGRSRRIAAAARQPDCPACARDATADAARVESVVQLTADHAWAEAASAAPICLDHLVALMAVRPTPPAWAAVEAAQLGRLRRLGDHLEAFAHTSSHDRRHRQTDAQRAAPDEAAAMLAGGVPADDRPGMEGRGATTARAVLLTGVYGAGKTTAAIELVDRLGDAGVPVAGIDLDWLGWYGAPVPWDEHEDPRLTLENLRAVRGTYLRAGVRRFVLAGTVRGAGQLERLRAAIGMPMAVVRLEVPRGVVEGRLRGDPNASRADDLAVATAELTGPGGATPVDWVVRADRPVTAIADEVLERLGWMAAPTDATGA